MGLEPTRAYTHKILSLACLPIPALPLTAFQFSLSDVFSPTKNSIAQSHLNCKPVFRKFIPEFIQQNPVIGHMCEQQLAYKISFSHEFIESGYSKNPAHLCTGLSVMQKKGLEPS